jgi:serine/threonine protein kinase
MVTPGALLQNRYQILRQLGAGGMGTVYLAYDLRLGNRLVVVKENQGGDPYQFQIEANLLATLSHPSLPRVGDHFLDASGAQYLVMDYIEGQNLDLITQQQGALPEGTVLGWMYQVLDAVEYLHANRVVHRDIKPENIIITPLGKAVLVDFGIAKQLVTGRPTLSGARAATPGYAAPEQYRGGTDQRSDIYSLGATMYALLTGGAPPDSLARERGTAILVPPRRINNAISQNTEDALLIAVNLDPGLSALSHNSW